MSPKKKRKLHGKPSKNTGGGGWHHATTGVNGQGYVFGVNLFDYKWEYTGRHAEVRDPLYGQTHSASICAVTINGRKHEFAYAEFSNGIYGFYTH